MVQDICSVLSICPVILQLNRNVLSILLYSGMPIFLNRKTYFSPWLQTNHQHLREFGICRILKACSSTRTSAVRQFKVPELRFDAREVYHLIDWQNSHITEPPLTTDILEEHVKLFVTSGEPPKANLPCHTQAVERCVKLVTKSPAAVCGAKSRDVFIQSRLESRLIMPPFNTKPDYREICAFELCIKMYSMICYM
jgi:hypothetical protein